jgi:hypothetical protein
MTTSLHYQKDRKHREEIIQSIGYGNTIKTTRIDRGDPRGAEIHELSDTGIIHIYTEKTHMLITRFIATPNQVKRYYTINEIVPQFLIALAIAHKPLSKKTHR